MSKNLRGGAIALAIGILVTAALAATLLTGGDVSRSSQDGDPARLAALASDHSPTIGAADAKVHIVEFLDPACETCALFYPMVKQWMAEVPGEIRLSIRHLAFHEGADYAVKVLEASRKQDKYWETLEALLMSQRQWTQHHVVLPDRILPSISSVGLDMEQLQTDMESFEVKARIEQDKKDAVLLRVIKTPGYFVNGRELQVFGREPLANLVREELEK